MMRAVFTEIGIFLIPFAGYALFILANRANVLHSASWPFHVVVKLAFGALVLVILSLLLLAQFSGAPPGSTYTPAHVENGRLVPGQDR